MSYCSARWNIAWRWTCKENLLDCQPPISCAVPNSQGHILTIYAKEGCRQSPATAFARQEEQLLSLLVSHSWSSETSPALLRMAAAAPSQEVVKSLWATWEPFGVKLWPRWNSIGIFLFLFTSLLHFLLLFPLSAFTAFPFVFFPYGSFILCITISLEIPWQLWHFSQQKSVSQ